MENQAKRREWTKDDVRQLKTLARQKTPVGKIAKSLKRTAKSEQTLTLGSVESFFKCFDAEKGFGAHSSGGSRGHSSVPEVARVEVRIGQGQRA
jgi:hypothetical protein